MWNEMPDHVSAVRRSLELYTPFENGESAALRELVNHPTEVPAGTELALEGDEHKTAYAVLEGWGYSFKDHDDGGRQVINVEIPGEFLGLRTVLLRTADHSYAALTDCLVAPIRLKQFETVFTSHPRVGMAILWTAAREEAMLAEHLVNLGQRTALERVAHFLCELGHRMQTHGLRDGNGFECPLRQQMLADVAGLSVVHLNRSLRILRERGLIATTRTGIQVADLAGLEDVARFDDTYLDHSRGHTRD